MNPKCCRHIHLHHTLTDTLPLLTHTHTHTLTPHINLSNTYNIYVHTCTYLPYQKYNNKKLNMSPT